LTLDLRRFSSASDGMFLPFLHNFRGTCVHKLIIFIFGNAHPHKKNNIRKNIFQHLLMSLIQNR
jgi:hypothetical protein